jgi:hypothetical protein
VPAQVTLANVAPVATFADGNARSMPRARAPTDKFMGSDIFMPEAYAAGGATSGISCTSDASEDQGRSARTARRRLPIRSPSQQQQPGGTSGSRRQERAWSLRDLRRRNSVIIITRCRCGAALPWSGVLAGRASLRPDWLSGSAQGLAGLRHSRRSAAVCRIYIRRLAPRG